MKKINFFLFALLLLFVSCDSKKIFSENKTDFLANQWQKKEVLQFDVIIEDESKNYDFTLNLSHVYDFQFDKIPLIVSIKNPDGMTELIPFDLEIKDKTGKDKGDCVGDICDLKQTFLKNKNLKMGNYAIAIYHDFNNSYLPNIIAVGLDVSITE